jgi:hypothetical protein
VRFVDNAVDVVDSGDRARHGAHDREHARGRADAERECDDAEHRKDGRAAQAVAKMASRPEPTSG